MSSTSSARAVAMRVPAAAATAFAATAARSLVHSTGPSALVLVLLQLTAVAWPGSDAAPLTDSPPLPDTANAGNTDVILAHVVSRHGARTPVDTYPNDPHINDALAPVGWGQLTNEGKMQQYKQGQFLRERYNELLGPYYSPKIIEARSTNKDRTKMSAQLELAGLWPPRGSQQWNPDLPWQPIPVKSLPVDEDHLLLGYQPCARYYQLRDAVLDSKEVQNQLKALDAPALYENLTRITNLSITNPDDVQSLYSTLKAEEGYGLKLPEWTKEYYPQKMEMISALSFEYNAYTDEQQIIKGGPLLKKMMDDNHNKINGSLDTKLFMYSGHDSSVVNLLKTMNVWDTQIPGYGILILVELHQDKKNGDYGIKVFLRNSTDVPPFPLVIPGCSQYCPIYEFENLLRNKTIFNWDELCTVDDPNYVPPDGPPI